MSILSDPVIVDLLKTKFIPVAVDQHDHRRRKDADGKLFARILKQAGRSLDGQAQGFYLISPDGKLLEFANTLSAAPMKRMLSSALKKYDGSIKTEMIDPGKKDQRFLYEVPRGGLVVDVTSKVLGGYKDGTKDSAAIQQTALGRDHLWLRKDEAEALAKGELPKSVKVRLARFHLVDNTRGEPPFWKESEVKRLDLTLDAGRLSGSVHLETRSGDRGCRMQVRGVIEAKGGKVTRFDAVAKGVLWGQGPYNRGAPQGKYPFAVAFTLASGEDASGKAPPGAARGNLDAYLR